MKNFLYNNPKVLIIIPNWDGKFFLEECLSSLYKTSYDNFDILIVDNGSTDNSVEYIKGNFSKVNIIKSAKNEGFARACNKGILVALENKYDFALLLNNDTVVDRYFLNEMIKAFRNDEKIGIMSSKIYYYDEPKKIWFDGAKFVWWRSSWKFNNWQKIEKEVKNGLINSDFATGCVMLIKLDVVRDIGLLFEPYFLSYEDNDFCSRAKRKNWKIKVCLSSKVWHKVSSSRSGEYSFSNGYYGTRNRLDFAFRKSNNYIGGLFLLLIIVPVRSIQWFFMGKKEMLKGLICGVVDFLNNKMGERN